MDAFEWERTTIEQQLHSSAERVAHLEDEARTQRSLLEDARQRQTVLQSAAETARFRDEELAEQLSELRLAVADRTPEA